MANVAKLSLSSSGISREIKACNDCPYCKQHGIYMDRCCTYQLQNYGIEIGDGTSVPDFCPFVLERLRKVIETIEGTPKDLAPSRWIEQVEQFQKVHPNPKFGADHGWGHAKRVYCYGADFLEQCVGYGIISNNSIQKWKLLLRIASLLHDVGLADSLKNHARRSAELAVKYLSGVDMDEKDTDMIIHAIRIHSDAREIRNVLDAALVMGDKLDVTKARIVRKTDKIADELLKVDCVEFKMIGKNGTLSGAKLSYEVKPNFEISILKEWPKCVLVPQKITTSFLRTNSFRFFVNNEEIDFDLILN